MFAGLTHSADTLACRPRTTVLNILSVRAMTLCGPLWWVHGAAYGVPPAEIRGSNPWGLCGWLWQGTNSALPGLVAASPWGGGAAVWRLMARRSGLLVPQARWGPAGARHRLALLRTTAGSPCRRCICRGGITAEPRSITHPHVAWWRFLTCGTPCPLRHWRQDGGGSNNGATRKVMGVVLYVWDYVSVGDSESVQGSEISTRPPTAVLLGYEMESGWPWSLGTSGCTVPQHGVVLNFGHGQAGRRKAAGWPVAALFWSHSGACLARAAFASFHLPQPLWFAMWSPRSYNTEDVLAGSSIHRRGEVRHTRFTGLRIRSYAACDQNASRACIQLAFGRNIRVHRHSHTAKLGERSYPRLNPDHKDRFPAASSQYRSAFIQCSCWTACSAID